MFDARVLVDLGRALGLFDMNSPEEAVLLQAWFDSPGPWVNTQAALTVPANQALLVDAIEAILGDLDPTEGDGVALLRVDPSLPFGFALSAEAGRLTLGVILDLHAEDGAQGYGLSGQVILPVVAYEAGELSALASLDLQANLEITLASKDPFGRARVDVSLQTDFGGSAPDVLVIRLRGEDVQGLPEPIEATFTLDLSGGSNDWEVLLLQLAAAGVQMLLGQLATGANLPAAVQQSALLVMDHLIPLLGWAPGDVPTLGGAYRLQPLPIDAFFQAPEAALSAWVDGLFSGADADANAQAALTHLGPLLAFGDVGAVALLPQAPVVASPGARVWSIPLFVSESGPSPRLLLWVGQDLPGARGLCLGVDVLVGGPDLIHPPGPSPVVSAEPQLQFAAEVLAIPFGGGRVQAMRKVELLGALAPTAGATHILTGVGGDPGDPILEHLGALRAGVRLVQGASAEPVLEMLDLKVAVTVQGSANIEEHTWARVDLTKTDGLITLGAGLAVSTIGSALNAWLGNEAAAVGVSLAHLLGLTASPTAPSAFPQTVTAGATPLESQLNTWLVSDLPQAFRQFFWALLDGGGAPHFAHWLGELMALINGLHGLQGGGALTLSGAGTVSDPWRVPVLPDAPAFPFSQNLALTFAVTQGATPQDRILAVEARMKAFSEIVPGTASTVDAELVLELGRLTFGALPFITGQGGVIDAATCDAQLMGDVRLDVALDSGVTLAAPSIPGFTAELGEAVARARWQRGAPIRAEILATAADLRVGGQSFLNNPAGLHLVGGQPPEGWEDLNLRSPLLLAILALDHVGGEEADATLTRAGDALMGLAQLLGWTDAISTIDWADPIPPSGKIADVGALLGEELPTFLSQRLAAPGDHPLAVGTEALVGLVQAMALGDVFPHTQGVPCDVDVTGAGTRLHPHHAVMVKGGSGQDLVGLLAFYEGAPAAVPGTTLGLTAAFYDEEDGGIRVTARARSDVAFLPLAPQLGADPLDLLPMNLAYGARIFKDGGGDLYEDTGKDTHVAALRLGLAWDDATGITVDLTLEGVTFEGQAVGDIPLSDPLAAPLLDAIEQMPGSPFDPSHPAHVLLMILAAAGLVSLGAGGPSGFLAAPTTRFIDDPGAYLRAQFIDPQTGALRLAPLMAALEGSPSAPGLLEVLGLKRGQGQDGPDLSVASDGTLHLTLVDDGHTWVDVGFNPLTRHYSHDVHYPPNGEGIFVAHSEAGLPQDGRFKLWVDFDQKIITKLLGSSRLSFAPLDKPVFWRFIAVVGAALGVAGGLIAAFVYGLKPWLINPSNPLKDVFKALGILNAQGQLPKLKDLGAVFGDLEGKIFANDTLVALDAALGADWIYAGKALRTGLEHRPVSAPDSSLFRFGSTDHVNPTFDYGYLPLGAIGGLNLQVAAGGEMVDDVLTDLGVEVDFGIRFNWASGGFGLKANLDPAGAFSLDLDIADAHDTSSLPLYPAYDLQGLGGFLNLLSAGGQMLIALVLERTVKALHDLSEPKARDLVAHLIGGFGIAKMNGNALQWDQNTGVIEVDQTKLAALIRPAAGSFPADFIAQMDATWLTEALFDILDLCKVSVSGGTNPTWTDWGPNSEFKYLTFRLFPSSQALTLKVIAGNYEDAGKVYTDPGTDRGKVGAGVVFEVKALRGGDPCFALGDPDALLLWAYFDGAVSRFKLDGCLPLSLSLPLKHSGYLMTLGAEAGLTYGLGSGGPGMLTTAGKARLLVGMDQPGAVAQGLEATILPTFAGPVGLKVEAGQESDPGLTEAITTLAITTVVELLLWQAETAADGKALLDLPIPFVNQTLGDVLAGFGDENQAALLQHNSPWSALGNVAKIKPNELLPQLLDSLAGSITDPVKLEIVGSGAERLYGVRLTQMDTLKVLPNASLVLGNEPGFGDGEPPGYYPITLWLLTFNTATKALSFTPNLEVRDVGFKFHGKEGAPLVQGGKFTLGSVTVAGAGSTLPGAAYGGARLAISEVGLPLGASDENSGPASKLLAEDGSNPTFSIALAYNYASAGEGFRVILDGADEDGILWFTVGKETGAGDVGRIGVLYDDSPTGQTPPVPVGLQEMAIFVEGSFGLGPVEFSVEGFGVRFALQDILRPKDWHVELEGLGIHYETETLLISGALRKYEPDPPELPGYAGAALIRTPAFELSAIGAYSQILDPGGDPKSSLFVFGMFTMDPGIGGPPFFFVTGLAGGFGYNRSLVIPEDLADIPDHVLLQAMGSSASAFELIQDVQRDLPATLNAWWLAFGVSFTSFGVIKGDALLYVLLDQGFTIGLIGTAFFKQPAAKPVVNVGLAIDAGFSTTGDDPRLWVKAQITAGSWVLVKECIVYGGFALAAWFKRGDMVLTLGGYHPSFRKPDHYPAVPRVGLTFSPMPSLTVKGECYFAITPREMMGGARIEITYFKQNDKHPLKGAYAFFEAGFDALIGWDPFYYDIYAYIGVYAALRNRHGNNIISLSAKVELKLWGPPFGGWARAQISIFALEFTFGKGRGEVATAYLSVPDFARKHLIPDAPPSALITLASDLYLLRDSARVSAEKGMVPMEADKDAPASAAATDLKALRVRSEFTLGVGFQTPATRLSLARNGNLSTSAGDWWTTRITEPGQTAERRIDLAPANKVDWTLPTLMVLRRWQGGALGPVIPLEPGLQLQILPRTGGFPLALYDKTATNAQGEMVLDLLSGVELRFLTSRPGMVTYTEQPETNASPDPVALNGAGTGLEVFTLAATPPSGGGGGGTDGGGGGGVLIDDTGDVGMGDGGGATDEARVAAGAAAPTRASEVEDRFARERAAAVARIAARRAPRAAMAAKRAGPEPLRFTAQSLTRARAPEAPRAIPANPKAPAPAPVAPPKGQSFLSQALKGRTERLKIGGLRAPALVRGALRGPGALAAEVKAPVAVPAAEPMKEAPRILAPTVVPGVTRGKSVARGGRRPAAAKAALDPQGDALNGAGFVLSSGAHGVFTLPGRGRVGPEGAHLALEGDQRGRIVALDRAGALLMQETFAPGRGGVALPEGTHGIYLEGLGAPPAKGSLAEASAPGRGGQGTGPGHTLYHIRQGTFAMAGGAFTVLRGQALLLPEGRRHRAERVLGEISALRACFPAMAGTLVIRLRGGGSGADALLALAEGVGIETSAVLGPRRLVAVGAERFLMVAVDAPEAFTLTFSLGAQDVRLAGLSCHPEEASILLTALTSGARLLPIEDAPLSQAGQTLVRLESHRG